MSQTAKSRGRPGKPKLLVPGISTLVMLVVLIGLGTWQVQRLAWKRGVLAQIAAAEAGPATPLTADPSPYAKMQVSGRFRDDLAVLYGAEGRDTRAGPLMGAQLIVPLERDGAPTVLIDRGWVPTGPRGAIPAVKPGREAKVEGYIRPAERAGLFSPADDRNARRFYTLNPQAIGAALGLSQVAPFTLVAMGPQPPEAYPDPARTLPRPPNNHLVYAITWYGLALSLLVIFALYARKVLRP